MKPLPLPPKPVMLVPTQGCYQEPIIGKLVGESPTMWHVIMVGEGQYVRRYYKSTMMAVKPWDRNFPNRKLVIPEMALPK